MIGRSPLAYAAGRGALSEASAASASIYLGSLAVIAFAYSNPIVLAGAGLAVTVAALGAGAGRALAAAGRWGVVLGVFVVAVNGLSSQRGDTILARLGELPLLGRVDVSAEALAEGAVLALRIVVVLGAFAVHSACVDPDRMLRLLRPLARRSALTATLITRLVPLAAADHARLREAAALRGPAAAPVGRAALVRRLVAGSLDRAVDVAAALELRGYARGARARAGGASRPASRHSWRFAVAGIAILALGFAARAAGAGAFEAYPAISLGTGAATLTLGVMLPAIAALPFLGTRGRHG